VNVNSVHLAGNLTRDPEIRFLANENCVSNFSLAINRKFKGNDGQMKEEVTFVDCEAWGKTAELIAKYPCKGKPIYLEGRLKMETWQDKDGKQRSRLKVVVDNIQFVGTAPAKTDGAADRTGPPPSEYETKPQPAPRPAPSGAVAPGADEPPF
jgi:single-strand DNA-binding protein